MEGLRATWPRPEETGARVRAAGVIANACKRLAELHARVPPWPILSSRAASGDVERAQREAAAQKESRRALAEARGYYLEIFRLDGSQAWAMVQYLGLTAALTPPAEAPPDIDFGAWWTAARVLAGEALKSPDPQRQLWAHAALVELYVLAQLLPEGHAGRQDPGARASEHLGAMVGLAGPHFDAWPDAAFDLYATRRQLLRYAEWWWRDRADLRALPERLSEALKSRGVSRRHERV